MTAGTYEYKSDFARRYIEQGRAEGFAEARARGFALGQAKSVLDVLTARSVPVSDEIRERVLACTDPDQLTALLARAITADSAAELFDGH